MTHEHDFVKDLDGQVTCSICGAMDDEKGLVNLSIDKTINMLIDAGLEY